MASFCMGTRKLYDYIDDNPAFSFHPTEYVNDPYVISRQHKQVAINVALEVDLTGQVCADSLGTQFYSGIGGQVDFNRGAARCPVARRSSPCPPPPRNGTVSRIVTRLSPGAGVVTTRGDVHYVVTEYGVAYLHGKSVQERAMAPDLHRAPGLPAQVAEGGHRGQISAAGHGPRSKANWWSARPNSGPPTCSTTARRSTSGPFVRRTSRACATCSTRCRSKRSTTASCPT